MPLLSSPILAISEGATVAILVAGITAIPATLAAMAAFRKSKEVAEAVVPKPGASGVTDEQPNVGEMIANIYEGMGRIEGLVRGHVADTDVHNKPRRRR